MMVGFSAFEGFAHFSLTIEGLGNSAFDVALTWSNV